MELSLLSIIHGRVVDIGYSLQSVYLHLPFSVHYFKRETIECFSVSCACICVRANYMAPKTGNMILLIKYNEEMKETTHDCRAITIIN